MSILCSPDSSWYLTGGPPRFDAHNYSAGVQEKLKIVKKRSQSAVTSSSKSTKESQMTPGTGDDSISSSTICNNVGSNDCNNNITTTTTMVFEGSSSVSRTRRREDEEGGEEEEGDDEDKESTPRGMKTRRKSCRTATSISPMQTFISKEKYSVTKETIYTLMEEVTKEKQRSRDLAKLIAKSGFVEKHMETLPAGKSQECALLLDSIDMDS